MSSIPEEYADVQPEWEVLTYKNRDGLFPAMEIDWEVKILVGSLQNAHKITEPLEELVRTQEERLCKHTAPKSDGHTMLDDTHLTARYENWNVFYMDHPAVEVLWNYIAEGFKNYMEVLNINYPSDVPTCVQSWGNVLRKSEDIGEHTHASNPCNTVMSTNFCVTADETTATVYNLPGYKKRKAEIVNEPGQLVVFPPWIPHYTTPFEYDDSVRITIASDFSMASWESGSINRDGQRVAHWLPFDEPPRRKKIKAGPGTDWGDIPGVDGTIAQLVNYEGELTREVVEEMKRTGSDYGKRVLIPEGYEATGEEVDPRHFADSNPTSMM